MAGRDIDEILVRMTETHPQVSWRQLRVTHPADDDGLWFFNFNGVEVQIESSSGNFPFLIESDRHPRRQVAGGLPELLQILESELGL